MIILLLLSLLTVDTVKVHRAEGRDVYQCSGISDGMGWSTGCDNPHHYFDAVITEKCDMVVIWEATANKFLKVDCDSVRLRMYRLENCHPETTLVDSGVTDLEPTNTPKSGDVKVWNGKSWEWRSQPQTLDSAELADIREMLREWRVEKCYRVNECWPFLSENSTITTEMWHKRNERNKAVRDSCECVYGGKK